MKRNFDDNYLHGYLFLGFSQQCSYQGFSSTKNDPNIPVVTESYLQELFWRWLRSTYRYLITLILTCNSIVQETVIKRQILKQNKTVDHVESDSS